MEEKAEAGEHEDGGAGELQGPDDDRPRLEGTAAAGGGEVG